MSQFLDQLLIWVQASADFMWGQWMIALLVGTGILLTIVTKGVQVRKFFLSMSFVFKGALGKDKTEMEEGDISPFAALMTALAATVGNGNIAGVATAIATGGPGAPFWMWVSAFFGMATKYAEGFLGVKYRKVAEDGTMAGGPMYYARYGIKNQTFAKILGMVFAVCGGATALLGTGNMMQSNSMALAFKTQFGVPTLVSAVILTILTGLVIIGGIKRIGAVTEKLVPLMILFYFLGVLVILIVKVNLLWDAAVLIFKSAFSLQAAGGALIGTSIQKAISLGVRRGVLSNEAGLGSAAIAQSAAKSPDPAYNGLLAMTGTFIDSIFVNTLTTFTIVVTGVWKLTPAAGMALGAGGMTSTQLTVTAFNSVIPYGGVIIALASFLFGYSTLIAWAYYGEQCLEYIWGIRAIMPYRLVFIALLFIGAIITGKHINIVWYIGDTFNAIMALPNLIALIALSGVVAKITNEYYVKSKFDRFK
ncbi:MAG: sodium:alanine symporter family protein [Calditrichaeota bacterium]|nr:sodium:alanine symporter family protein [Calditrichota bacterium]